jgi:hypothetical protein
MINKPSKNNKNIKYKKNNKKLQICHRYKKRKFQLCCKRSFSFNICIIFYFFKIWINSVVL